VSRLSAARAAYSALVDRFPWGVYVALLAVTIASITAVALTVRWLSPWAALAAVVLAVAVLVLRVTPGGDS
jgi:hypothetical protein